MKLTSANVLFTRIKKGTGLKNINNLVYAKANSYILQHVPVGVCSENVFPSSDCGGSSHTSPSLNTINK